MMAYGMIGEDSILTKVIQEIYGNASNAVLLNVKNGDFFWTSVVSVRGCLLSSVMFKLFLENILQETHHGITPLSPSVQDPYQI
ncbi:hypothetical protein DPMN_034648 [Dreissena polymorpha]|uniref:Uncharacterized protein n=1 Tax=Dreissena polymorpha TaxID=45954 RepID=A0A9D4M887_DREPO|nr:hypothetical protein DPMN_034648 [Dreissena polymorpha]